MKKLSKNHESSFPLSKAEDKNRDYFSDVLGPFQRSWSLDAFGQ